MWKNRREVQREITKELKLEPSVMVILDKQDEDDDFWGIDERSRDEIYNVAQVIDQTLSATKFIMFFINGSDEEIDVSALGIPVTRFGKNIVIWTFDKGSLTIFKSKNIFELIRKLNYTHVIWYSGFSISEFESSNLCGLLHQQATTIVTRCPCMKDIDPTMVTECRLYGLLLLYNFHHATNLDWLSHASNYWICDAIIKGDRAWDISKALHGEISWECDASLMDEKVKQLINHLEPRFLVLEDGDVYKEGPYRWISVTSRNAEVHGMQTIPAEASSFFLAFERSGQQMGSEIEEIEEIEEWTELFKKHSRRMFSCFPSPQITQRSSSTYNPSTDIPNGLFENSNNLGVLVLCSCAFSFASPPFRKSHNLRFLGLDRCTHKIGEEGNNDHAEWAWLCNLLVLDLRYTGWDEILSEEKMDLMRNIRELNIEGVKCWKYTAQLQGRLPNLERLRIIRPTSPWETSNDVDNSFIDKTGMEILDLSGNSYMKVLPTSLSKASSLQVLILDGCDGLEEIGRLPRSLRSFSFDGYRPASQRTPTIELPLKYIRLSNVEDNKDISTSKISLEGCIELDNLFLCGLNNLVELDLSGTAIKKLDFNTTVVQVPRLKRLYLIGCEHLRSLIFLSDEPDLELMCVDTRGGIVCPRPAIDKTKSFCLQDFPQPLDTRSDRHIEIGEGSCYVEDGVLGTPFVKMESSIESMYLHDVPIHSSTFHNEDYEWHYLRWCCVERCPELDTVFLSCSYGFPNFETLWASDLLMARWIWSKGSRHDVGNTNSFRNLQHLHLRSCPSIQFVLPVWVSSFPSLQTLHIIHCDNLGHVFILDNEYPEEITTGGFKFPKLKTVHLHDLPKLQEICEVKMVAPALESIKIRGCWGLRRLPSVAARALGARKPTVEIEKDVWDALEWDAGHCPDHFEAPVHSRYYKKKLPKVSFLR
uniref:Uncharacterized protein n=1 Tax=Avena sativa TaxID=4498 RepID=A0ACD5VEX9_AVESA